VDFGDFSRHFGLFKGCGDAVPFASAALGASTAPCC